MVCVVLMPAGSRTGAIAPRRAQSPRPVKPGRSTVRSTVTKQVLILALSSHPRRRRRRRHRRRSPQSGRACRCRSTARSSTVTTFGTRSPDVLDEEGIELGPHDAVAPSLDTAIGDGTAIAVVLRPPADRRRRRQEADLLDDRHDRRRCPRHARTQFEAGSELSSQPIELHRS